MKGIWIGTILALLLAVGLWLFLPPSRGRPVEQPIAFSHRIHAGENRIPCLYCHPYARRAAVAGIPAVSRCIGCHGILKGETQELKKLKAYWARKEPIPWVKVYDQPDFVRFSHKRHLWAGIDCTVCHGPVETMDRMEEVVVLNMDRCVSCHMEQKASIDCATCHK